MLDKETIKTQKESKLTEWHKEKLVMAHKWIDDTKTQMGRMMIRGAVHKCKLGENVGTEQGEYRPVVVLSNDRINTTSGNVTVVPLTKNVKYKEGTNQPKYKSHYVLKKDKYSFLEFDSAVLGEETKTVSKIRLGEHLGNVDQFDLDRIITRVKWVLGI